MHAHRFGMNFEETIVGKLTEVYQTVHLKEFTDFPKKDEEDPTTVITDIHFEKKSVAYEAYHLSHIDARRDPLDVRGLLIFRTH